jgi:hypothetical protein
VSGGAAGRESPARDPTVHRGLALFGLACALACRGAEPAGPPPAPGALYASLVRTATATRTLRTEGRVTYWGNEGRVRLRTIVLAERPDRFRVETLTPFEEPIDVVASDGARIWWLSRSDLKVGPATATRLGEVLPLPLAPRGVVDVLIGGVPTSTAWRPVEVEPGRDGTWTLSMVDMSGHRARLSVDRDAPRVRRISLPARAEQPAIEVELSDHDGLVARDIDLRVPSRDLEVQIRLRSPEYGVVLPEALFRVQPPPGRTPSRW